MIIFPSTGELLLLIRLMFIIMFIFEVVAGQRQIARRGQSTNTTTFATNLTIAIYNDIAATNNLS